MRAKPKIQTEANILAATETRVDAKIAQLKDLQTQITALLAQRDAAQEKQVAALVKTYSAMKPKKAAPHLRQPARRWCCAGGPGDEIGRCWPRFCRP